MPPVTLIVPPHCGVDTVAVRPPAPGKVSIKPRPVLFTAPTAVLSIVKVSVLVCPTPIVLSENALVSTGRGRTTRVSVAVVPVREIGVVAVTALVVFT